MYDLLLLVFGVAVGIAGVSLLLPFFGTRCEGPLTVVIVGVLCLGSVDPIARALSIYSGHFFEATGGLFVLLGLFESVRRNLGATNWAALFDTDYRSVRPRQEWMVPMDDRILELLEETEIVLTPALIAYNSDYSREAVNRRLLALRERGFVERLEHGKYRITSKGRRYLHCDDDVRADVDATDVSTPGSTDQSTSLDD